MSTIAIRRAEGLKARALKLQADFDALAEARYARIVQSGMTLSWADTRACLEKRMAGQPVDWPQPHKLAG